MECLLCKTDITEPIKQFGSVRNPLCQSCYLNGNTWVYGEEVIVDELLRGTDLETAQKVCVKEEMTELESFARSFFTDTFSLDPADMPTPEDDAARMAGG